MTKLEDLVKRIREQLTDKEREILDERLKRPIAPDSKLGKMLDERLKRPIALDPKLDLKPELTSKPDRVSREMAQAREAFSRHAIVKGDIHGLANRWLVREPGTNTFWFEVVILAGGSMIVHGDIQAVIFGRYSPSEKTPEHVAAVETVRWMASRKRPDDGYFVEKACVGGTAEETIWRYDEDTLREEIAELIKEVSEGEVNEDERLDELVEILDRRVGNVPLEQIQQEVIDVMDGDWERGPRGKIISTAMVYAHAALQRLMELLDTARDKARHEPWC